MSFNTQQLKLENRITKLETAFINMHQDILDIKNNELVHLHNRLEAGGKIVVGILVGLIMNLVGVIISILR